MESEVLQINDNSASVSMARDPTDPWRSSLRISFEISISASIRRLLQLLDIALIDDWKRNRGEALEVIPVVELD